MLINILLSAMSSTKSFTEKFQTFSIKYVCRKDTFVSPGIGMSLKREILPLKSYTAEIYKYFAKRNNR
jgi:hypothetical protein